MSNKSEAPKMSLMERMAEKVGDLMGPLAETLQRSHFLMAITETMQALLPITIIGAFACLLAAINIPLYQAWLQEHPALSTFFMTLQSLTLSIYSLYVILFLSYNYSKKLKLNDPIMVVPFALSSFLLLTPVEIYRNIPMKWLGHAGLFSAMIVTFLVVRIIKFLQDKHVTIKLPAGVPHYVSKSFEVLIPALIILPASCAIGQICANSFIGSFHNLIYMVVQAPLQKVGLTFPVYLFYEILATLAMFCGIHGSSMGAWIFPLLAAASQENLAAWTAGEALPNLIVSSCGGLILLGGYGATLGGCIMMFFFAKSKRYKQVSRITIIPQLFNIGEPFLFGVPCMLNPFLLVPYFGAVIFNTVAVYVTMATGLVGPMTGVTVPWTLSSWLSGLLGCSTPIRGMILQYSLILIDGLIWLPFIKAMDKKALAEETAESAQAIEA